MKKSHIVNIFVFFIVVFICAINLIAQDKTEGDEILVLLKEGTEYFNLGNQGAYRIAFEKFSAALEKCPEDGKKQCEALALNYLGQISLLENEKEKAVDFLNRALSAFQSIKKRDVRFDNLEHQILLGLGSVSSALGNGEKALEHFNELLALVVKRNEVAGQATVLAFIGNVYQSLKQKNKAFEKYQEALKIFQSEKTKFPSEILLQNWEIAILASIAELHYEYGEISDCLAYNKKILEIQKNRNDLRNAVMTLNNMHMISAAAGKPEEGFRYLDEAVAISQSLGDKNLESYILSFAVLTNSAEGDVTKAIEISKKILPLKQAQNDLPGQAQLLGIIGGIYLHLGNYPQAIDYYQRALPIYQSEGCRKSEAVFPQYQAGYCRQGRTTIVTGLGKALNGIGKKEDALRILEAELEKIESEQISDDQYKGMLLDVIGQIYFETNQNEKAIKYFSQALPLINNRNVRVKSLVITDIGKVQAKTGNKAEALLSYNQALLLLTPFVKNLKKGKEAAIGYTLTGLMLFYRYENPKAAAFFGKKAVEAYQRNREAIKKFDKDTQKTFLKSVEFAYRTLVEVLIEQNRLGEAQQILNSFKDQQFFDFDQLEQNQFKPLLRTPREADFVTRYEMASESVSKAEIQLEEIKRKIVNRQPNAEETAQLRKAESDLKTVSDEFTAVLKQAEIEFSKPADGKDNIVEHPDLREMQAALREMSQSTEQKAVAVYQLVGEENFCAIIITADDIKKVCTLIKAAALNEKARQFWGLLQSDRYDPRQLGAELYDTIFKPVEKELPKETKTILWSLDGNLRYVPMSALYDGEKKQYLVERFQNVVFTRADKERMTRKVSPVWTGTGFGGGSTGATVKVLGEEISFDALPGVKEELSAIFKDVKGSIVEGKTFQNAEFSKQNFTEAMKQRRPVVHIASHFSFRPGDEARSFLLMGNNTAFTLEEMKQDTTLFLDVELLTLSACNTAAQQPDATGREIDGFAELAQRLGAGAVMATLWSVADESTAIFMSNFYRFKKDNSKSTKAEAIHLTQKAMIEGKLKPSQKWFGERSTGVKTKEVKTKAQPFEFDESKPLAHPFYWSPFVLIGNWR